MHLHDCAAACPHAASALVGPLSPSPPTRQRQVGSGGSGGRTCGGRSVVVVAVVVHAVVVEVDKDGHRDGLRSTRNLLSVRGRVGE